MHCHPSFDNDASGGPTGFPLKSNHKSVASSSPCGGSAVATGPGGGGGGAPRGGGGGGPPSKSIANPNTIRSQN
jgi:hypothetical protein